MAARIRFTKAGAKPRRPIGRGGAKTGALARLDSFLRREEPGAVEFLVHALHAAGAAITYRELREAYLSGGMTREQFKRWQLEYSKMVDGALRPRWERAAEEAAREMGERYPDFAYEPGAGAAAEWMARHGAELVTNLAREQADALNAMCTYFVGHTAVTPDEAARKMRPCIGLTRPQAVANLRHQDAVRAAYLERHPNAAPETLDRKAKEAGARYAARQHRYRAQSIARTELAAGHNAGAYGATKDAQRQGYIGECRKKWLTAYDERVCPTCSAMDGEAVPMDVLFSNGRLLPPAHPQCRCAVEYEEIPMPTQAASGGTGTGLGNSLEGYTDRQKAEIARLLDNAPKEVRDAFTKYGRQFREVDSYVDPAIGRAYFRPADGRVHMKRQDAAAGSAYEARYQMHFHEYAHNLDYLAGNGNYASLAWRSRNGEMLEDIIEKDWDAALKNYFMADVGNGYMHKLEVQFGAGSQGGEFFLWSMLSNWRQINGLSRRDPLYLDLEHELNVLDGTVESCRSFWENHFDTFKDMVYDNFTNKKDVLDSFVKDIRPSLLEIERGGLSDMFERYAIKVGGNSYERPFGFGHKEAYALAKGNLSKEAFAEMTSASITNPKSLAQIKKYLPNAYNAYLEMLRSVI